jgi:hypothetical protein
MTRYIVVIIKESWEGITRSVTCVGQADTPEAAQQLASALHEESGNPYLRHFVVEVPG